MDKVIVLMSTYNGEKYLQQQLDSLYAQKNVEIEIIVRDDGSIDKTKEILEENRKRGLLKWYTGENIKPAMSFMDLVYQAPLSRYYAFCDQDDVWEEDKLEIALSKIKREENENPDKSILYYGRPRLVNASLETIKSPKTSSEKMTDYGSSIINSNATGCTMVFNRILLEQVKSKRPKYIFMHDAWFHKVCLICNGKVIFDNDVHIMYRQHANNVIGSSNSLLKKMKRHIGSLSKKDCIRSRTVESLLECYANEMSLADLEMSRLVINYKKGLKNKIKLLREKRISTKYFKRNLYYKVAVILNAF